MCVPALGPGTGTLLCGTEPAATELLLPATAVTLLPPPGLQTPPCWAETHTHRSYVSTVQQK